MALSVTVAKGMDFFLPGVDIEDDLAPHGRTAPAATATIDTLPALLPTQTSFSRRYRRVCKKYSSYRSSSSQENWANCVRQEGLVTAYARKRLADVSIHREQV